MNITGNTVLITGGATGIGFSLAEAFLKEGNTVIICGRREQKLKEAKERLPALFVRKCDLSKEKERKGLHEWVAKEFPKVNILVNNAGIQRQIDFRKGAGDLLSGDDEIQVNLKAPIYLTGYFLPELMKQKEAAVVNVTSGLGYIPIASMPVYCATKAALHSFSLSLRHQLKSTSVRVFELIPPMVDTELDAGSRETRKMESRGIPPSQVAVEAISAIQKDKFEISVGMAGGLVESSRKNPDEAFLRINSR